MSLREGHGGGGRFLRGTHQRRLNQLPAPTGVAVAAFTRNGWPDNYGTSGRIQAELAARNKQPGRDER